VIEFINKFKILKVHTIGGMFILYEVLNLSKITKNITDINKIGRIML
jgi:hypothetical protein